MSPKRQSSEAKSKAKKKDFQRIATEEAFSEPEQMEAMKEVLARQTEYDPDLFLWKTQTDPAGWVNELLLDLEGERMKLMKRPSEYFKQNFMITTSGMNWNPTRVSRTGNRTGKM